MGSLGTAHVHMQIDIGFGDVVHPEPIEAELPTILDTPVPRLLYYSLESAIAEKFEAICILAYADTRVRERHYAVNPAS